MIRLFVNGLPKRFDDDAVLEMFRDFGAVSAEVCRNHETGGSRGFAYVCMRHPEQAHLAIAMLDGTMCCNSRLGVEISRK